MTHQKWCIVQQMKENLCREESESQKIPARIPFCTVFEWGLHDAKQFNRNRYYLPVIPSCSQMAC